MIINLFSCTSRYKDDYKINRLFALSITKRHGLANFNNSHKVYKQESICCGVQCCHTRGFRREREIDYNRIIIIDPYSIIVLTNQWDDIQSIYSFPIVPLQTIPQHKPSIILWIWGVMLLIIYSGWNMCIHNITHFNTKAPFPRPHHICIFFPTNWLSTIIDTEGVNWTFTQQNWERQHNQKKTGFFCFSNITWKKRQNMQPECK